MQLESTGASGELTGAGSSEWLVGREAVCLSGNVAKRRYAICQLRGAATLNVSR
jgi:hypothetical protein